MKSVWTITHSAAFVLIVPVFGLVQNDRCIHKGFIIEGRGSKEFRVCSKDTDGGLTLKTFSCGENSVFSAEKKRCVLGSPVLQESNDKIHPLPNFDAFQSTATTTSRPLQTERPKDQPRISYFESSIELFTTTRLPLSKNINSDEREPFYQYRNRGYTPSTTTSRLPTVDRAVPRKQPQPILPPPKEWERGVNPLTIPKSEPEHKECPIARGRFCHTCTTLVSCVNFRVVSVEHCSSCSPYMKTCTNEFVPECVHENNFVCTSFGLFPDPYFCNRYHFCRGPDTESYYFHCDPGMIYDTYLEECRDDISERYHYYSPCPSFPKCQEDFQVGVMHANKQFYYVCLEDELGILRRTLYKCPKNHIFNGNVCVYKD